MFIYKSTIKWRKSSFTKFKYYNTKCLSIYIISTIHVRFIYRIGLLDIHNKIKIQKKLMANTKSVDKH